MRATARRALPALGCQEGCRMLSGDSRATLSRRFTEQIVVCDGAMGTMLHSTGVPLDRSLCELNVTRPGLVTDLHAAYVSAGADIIQTNTFDGNRLRLSRVGLEDSVVELNIAGARLAREAARHSDRTVLVAGSVGPANSATAISRVPRQMRAEVLREQMSALADWVDLLMLETFGDLDSLVQAIEVALQETDLPIIAQLTFGDDGGTLRGEEPAAVVAVLDRMDLAAIGANCTVGPAALQDVIAELAATSRLPVSVQPNAGTPQRLGRQVRYVHNTAYFAAAAAEFIGNGASIVGGCCGTTPAHTREIAKRVGGLVPVRRSLPSFPASTPPVVHLSSPRAVSRPPPCWPADAGFVIIAGLGAPQGPDVAGFVEQARALNAAGAGVLAITEPAPPATRVGPVAAAVVLQERVGAEVLLPAETADRTLPALQADLLGAHALGLRMVVCRTGSPRVAGDYPDAAQPWEVDSVRLIAALRGLNEGLDYRGVATREHTGFVIGASISAAAADLEREVDRAEAKAQAGAHFLITDPIFDADEAGLLLAALQSRGVDLPVIASIAPVESFRALERLRNEVPAIAAAATALGAVRGLGAQPGEVIETSLELIEKLRGLLCGVLVHVPRESQHAAVDLLHRLVVLGSRS
ncbi:MAG: bifunctional homocysteine S-methyltransferase/methylenetetrahydrofolate reductase [Actinomycetota bacterium]|nr:bifunctional homocysteine S-methyltransferase/methylenetetrahydrofolate reductase [Actinomycetota bacterium]